MNYFRKSDWLNSFVYYINKLYQQFVDKYNFMHKASFFIHTSKENLIEIYKTACFKCRITRPAISLQ
uniref:Uncharacterized protein n=1 Tax=Octopus bimaculoides TaxID=37653 RepID=A0A0L8GLS7_OCTBM